MEFQRIMMISFALFSAYIAIVVAQQNDWDYGGDWRSSDPSFGFNNGDNWQQNAESGAGDYRRAANPQSGNNWGSPQSWGQNGASGWQQNGAQGWPQNGAQQGWPQNGAQQGWSQNGEYTTEDDGSYKGGRRRRSVNKS